jgi:RNA polymerase sigma-70 factor (ECF subfamily)
VFGIARRRAYDELRRRKYDTMSLDEEPDNDEFYLPIASSDLPLDEVTHSLLLQLEVQQVMERLPELQRQVLIMYCEENLSYQEIAEILETNVGTVKSRIHYAKRALRGMLRAETLEAIEAALS